MCGVLILLCFELVSVGGLFAETLAFGDYNYFYFI